jgi:hypothetical protein
MHLPILSEEFQRQLFRPVPVDVWRACLTLYQSARHFATPVRNPEEYKVAVGKTVVRFTDIPMNRGIVAVKEFLRDSHQEFFPAVLARLLTVGRVLAAARQQERFARFFQPDTDDGKAWMVNEVLLDALASVPLDPATSIADLEALHSIASELVAREEAEDRSRGEPTTG